MNVRNKRWKVLGRIDVQIRRHSQSKNIITHDHDSGICLKTTLPVPSWKKVQSLRRLMQMAC